MPIIKKYLKTKPVCNVTFSISAKDGKGFKTVSVVGDFNDWNPKTNMMKKLKSGEFKSIIKLACDNEYQFRYFLDGETWKNENESDRFVVTSFGDSENSVIKI